jgi:hypothetical protein
MATFDQIWIENRFRNRKGMVGTALRLDPETGYLEPTTKRGFSAEQKATFIKRFEVCNNQRQVAKSVRIDIQAVYDAIALDSHFREEFVRCAGIPGRTKRLNDELIKLSHSEKNEIIADLLKKTDKYK